jgi:hypothetical protein
MNKQIEGAERIERLNATLYLASCVPPGLIDQGLWTCGMAHCIGGWCALSNWHQRRGMVAYHGRPRYADCFGEDAFAKFHGITIREAKAICIENTLLLGVAAKRDLIRKLKALIRQYGGDVMYSPGPEK